MNGYVILPHDLKWTWLYIYTQIKINEKTSICYVLHFPLLFCIQDRYDVPCYDETVWYYVSPNNQKGIASINHQYFGKILLHPTRIKPSLLVEF